MKMIYFTLSFLSFFPLDSYCSNNHPVKLPDSLLTPEHVYRFTFSNFGKAQQIVKQMRERKSFPPHKIDITEGDLYFNTGRYYQALKFYSRALASDPVQSNEQEYMEQLHRMISCYDCLHNDAQKSRYIEQLLKKAEACNNKEMRSIALFNMGKTIYYQGNKEKGYLYMKQAVSLMEQSQYPYKYDNLRYNYNTLIIFQMKDKRYTQALTGLDSLEAILYNSSGKEPEMEGLVEKERKALYANRAVILNRIGKQKEAEKYYTLFSALGTESDKDNYLIMPYLFDREMYDQVIHMSRHREKFLISEQDTINYHMSTLKRSMANAYKKKKEYEKAMKYFEAFAVLLDSIKLREQQSAALELASVYETNEKEARLQKQETVLRIRSIQLLSTIGIVLLLGTLLYLMIRYNRIIKRKNMILAQNIQKSLDIKEELSKRDQACQSMKADLRQEYSISREKDALQQERELFERIEQIILTGKLYLKPDFNRKEIIKKAHIPHNRFAGLFREHAGVSFTEYLNDLRLEHAVKMLKKYPNYTIHFIAEESGINSPQTFYRVFQEKFGITPSEFRNNLKYIDPKPDIANP